MKQDLKILEEHLSFIKNFDNGSKYIPALENLIKAYKELEEYYEEQNEVNAKFILVSLVEETIEELNKQLEEDLQDERKVNSNRFIIICQCKNCLQELLEKRK